MNYLVSLVILAVHVAAQGVPARKFEMLTVSSNYEAYLVMQNIRGARTLLFDEAGDMVILARGLNQILAAYGDFSTLSSPLETTVIVDAAGLGLNHGMAIRGNYIYASSDTMVYRWPYTPGQRTQTADSERQTVITNISASGEGGAQLGHFTRTLVFGSDGYLYVSIGSLRNVDPNSFRARVRRVNFGDSEIPSAGFDFANMEVWADGLRNGVAIGFDDRGKLWEADNGPDRLDRPDLGVRIFNDNPAEELNLLDGPAGIFYGYPYCWTAGIINSTSFSDSVEKGTQYRWPASAEEPVDREVDDAWCQDPNNNRAPVGHIPAHSSPIGLRFLKEENGCGKIEKKSFSCNSKNDLFVTLHGSWNRDVPAGYRLIHMPMNDNGLPTNQINEIFSMKDYETTCIEGAAVDGTCFRPAGLTFDKEGTLWVSSAITGHIVKVIQVSENSAAPAAPVMTSASMSVLAVGWLFVTLNLLF